MSNEAHYYEIGNRSGHKGKRDPLIPGWNLADEEEEAAQRGWEACYAARAAAEAIAKARDDD